jgi:phage-related minor tail protein
LSDVLKGLALDMAEIALKAAGNALLESILGGLFGGGGLGPQFTGTGTLGLLSSGSFAKGAAFAGGRSITAFARGGALTSRILRRPTLFPLADGLGLAGEAGPEAVLPLTRMGSGELGVKAAITRLPEASSAGGPVVINEFTINAPGADREGLRQVMALIQVVRREGQDTRRMIKPLALSAVLDSRRRGGSIARAFGAR